MDDDKIREAIRAHYQVQIDNLGNTDELADLLDNGDDDELDRASRLLTDARIEIVWTDR
jgi:hypothetical protein